MTANSPELLLRPDLVQRRVWMGREPMWVIKDPLSRAFSYFNEQEHQILRLANGKRSLSQIASECQSRFAPQYISVESLVRFFADARKKGLLLVDGRGLIEARTSTHSGANEQSAEKRWWSNPLAVRLPGWNPDRFLDQISPFVRPIFTPQALLLAIAIMFIAAFVVARNMESVTQQLSIATSHFQTGAGVWMLIGVLSATKVVHELAHATACKRFGGECREIGVMLLVGVPCLYCDVSDAWMLPRRWQRVLVSAAGMIAELTLASLAALLWMMTVEGPLRDLCVVVMVVCSVTTVVFNGNPLLRYDGYYILSDCVGVPNLAGEASGVLNGWLRRLVWASPLSPSLYLSRRNLLLAFYSIASLLYRLAIYSLILLMIYRFAERREMGGPVGLLALTAMSMFLIKGAKSILAPPHQAARRGRLSMRRPLLVTGLCAAAVMVIGMVPLPRSTVAWMTVQPSNATPVYVTNGGRLREAVANGSDVQAGQMLVSLVNPKMDLELLRGRSERDVLESRLQGLKRRRNESREASSQIPEVERSLKEATEHLRLQERVAGQLVLHAPQSGRVFSASERADAFSDDREPTYWQGTPLDARNQGAWLNEGTPVCVIGDARDREAVLYIRQQDIELVQAGQRVTLLLADYESGDVRGRVSEVAATPSEEIPDELGRVGMIEVPMTNRASRPFYQVRVDLEPTVTPLPVRLTGQARVHVRPASLFHRLVRFLRDAFA
ncbi:MAG: HlyD family efflux transporter periplasmic adaptor subunit [Rubripirellula sp.]